MPENILTSYIQGWGGGINQQLSPKDIADDELVDALNFELNLRRSLRRRNGMQRVRNGGSPFGSNRTTSIYHYRLSDGTSTVLYTGGSAAKRRAAEAPFTTTVYTSIDGSVTLPSDTRWQWVTMDNVAIGVNGGSRAGAVDNPVVLTSATGSLVNIATDSWTGSPPDAPVGATVWNRRLWLIMGSTLYWSALGDFRNWTATGASGSGSAPVGADESDALVTIVPFQNTLCLLKKTRLYQLIPGSPNTDSRQFEIRPVSHAVGIVDAATLQHVLGDVLFLSHSGVVSLGGLLQGAPDPVVSRNLPSLAEVNLNATRLASHYNPETQKYWLAVPKTMSSGAQNKVVYELDLRTPGQAVPWMKHDGCIAAASYGLVLRDGRYESYAGGYDECYIQDSSRYDDNATTGFEATPPFFETKAFDLGMPLHRKEFFRFGVEFAPLTGNIDFRVKTRLDSRQNRVKTYDDTFSGSIPGSKLGPGGTNNQLGPGGTFVLGGGTPDDADFTRSIRGAKGRRAQTIDFTLFANDQTQGFEVRRLMLRYSPIDSEFGINDV